MCLGNQPAVIEIFGDEPFGDEPFGDEPVDQEEEQNVETHGIHCKGNTTSQVCLGCDAQPGDPAFEENQPCILCNKPWEPNFRWWCVFVAVHERLLFRYASQAYVAWCGCTYTCAECPEVMPNSVNAGSWPMVDGDKHLCKEHGTADEALLLGLEGVELGYPEDTVIYVTEGGAVEEIA